MDAYIVSTPNKDKIHPESFTLCLEDFEESNIHCIPIMSPKLLSQWAKISKLKSKDSVKAENDQAQPGSNDFNSKKIILPLKQPFYNTVPQNQFGTSKGKRIERKLYVQSILSNTNSSMNILDFENYSCISGN